MEILQVIERLRISYPRLYQISELIPVDDLVARLVILQGGGLVTLLFDTNQHMYAAGITDLGLLTLMTWRHSRGSIIERVKKVISDIESEQDPLRCCLHHRAAADLLPEIMDFLESIDK